MVHRDLKIGLVLGSVIVVGIVIKLATDPDLSPQARMTELSSSLDTQNKTDANNVTQGYIISSRSLDSVQPGFPPAGRSDSTLIARDDQLAKLFAPGQSPQGRTESQSDVIKPKEPVEKQQIPSGSSTPNERDGDNISTHSESKPTDTAYNSEALSEQSSQPGVFDYDNAEVFKTERFYIVGKNQTLSEISRIYYHSANQWQRIVDANPQIRDPNKIKPGMKLIIPWDDE